MKDMRERLSSLSSVFMPLSSYSHLVGTQLQPAMEAIKFIATQYKILRKETRALQGEIEPVVKQCKRDMLRTLADVDKQYKEMMRKYRKEVCNNDIVGTDQYIRWLSEKSCTTNWWTSRATFVCLDESG